MKKLLLLLIMSSLAVFAMARGNDKDDDAKRGTIKGQVLTSDGAIAAGVSVSIEHTNYNTLADDAGEFSFKVLPGTYTLIATYVGYAPVRQEVTVEEKKEVEVTLHLSLTHNELKDVIVYSKRNGYKINNTSPTLRLDEPLLEVPQNIQEVSAMALADQGVTQFDQGAIRNVSGATKLEHWADYTRINMRGSRASEFRNGMNVTSTWGPLTADMSVVDRIEFVKGPAGFMMSNGEPSGIFNIVTKKPTGVTKGEASVVLGSYDFYRGAIDLDGQLDKNNRLQYRFNIMGQSAGSFQKYGYNDRVTISPVIKYLVDDKTDVTVEYLYQYARMQDGGAAYVYSPKGYGDLPRDFSTAFAGIKPNIFNDNSVTLYLHHQFNPNWKLTVQGSYMNMNKEASDLWPSSLDSNGKMIRAISLSDAIIRQKFAQAFLNGKVQTGGIQHRILVGLDMGDKNNYYDWGQNQILDKNDPTADDYAPFDIYNPGNGTPSNGLPVFDRSIGLLQRSAAAGTYTSQSYTGLYLQDELGFFDNSLRLTLAGRYTYVTQNDYGSTYSAKKVTPRIGLSYTIDANTSVYALYDQAFNPQSGLLRGNKSPKPMTGNNMEIGVKRDWFGGRWNTTLSAYRILKNGNLVSDPDTSGGNQDFKYSLQIGQTKVQGLEFDVHGEIVQGLNLILNYALTDSKVTKDIDPANIGQKETGFAKHVSNGWLTYTIGNGALKGFGISAGYTFQGDRSTWAWASTTQKGLPDYFRMDGGLFWKGQKLSVNLNVNNLFDRYLYSGAPYANFYYYQAEAGRNLKLSFAYRF
ncbi:iron complex outermembrane recepter protein [Arachidicoccus rhizosphaerae]|uniref:Iron complex outermembrane recepter protein n=1 Tax=Arachidicoccus rhizosphaerae TaxID=551991 RepID=A0A1H3YWX7_9BACT|nr:TonB-dependent siderophore receptor [Arachidicoccus rhizosphaerae]SEA16083.1 iron complex outermembrane recepter protein [Arachidicoccus rhizosphaerae]